MITNVNVLIKSNYVTMVNLTLWRVCTDQCTSFFMQSESTETPSENICLNSHEKCIATLACLGFASLILFFILFAQEKKSHSDWR